MASVHRTYFDIVLCVLLPANDGIVWSKLMEKLNTPLLFFPVFAAFIWLCWSVYPTEECPECDPQALSELTERVMAKSDMSMGNADLMLYLYE